MAESMLIHHKDKDKAKTKGGKMRTSRENSDQPETLMDQVNNIQTTFEVRVAGIVWTF